MNQWKRERKRETMTGCSEVLGKKVYYTDMRKKSTAEAEPSERRVHSRHDHGKTHGESQTRKPRVQEGRGQTKLAGLPIGKGS